MVEEMHDGWYNHPVIQEGALAQLASALPWHGRGQGFESLMLHQGIITDKKIACVVVFFRFAPIPYLLRGFEPFKAQLINNGLYLG